MKRSGVAIVITVLALAVITPSTQAATTWTARLTGHGVATIRVGSPSKLSIGLTGFKVGSRWSVSLRRGSCSSLGTLVYSIRLTAGSTGRLTRTITLSSTQTRSAKLPLTLRAGSMCTSFKAPVPAPTPVPGSFVDGIYAVGTGDVQPGTYRAAGSTNCFWERLLALSNQEVLGNRAGSGPSMVTILPTDGAFRSTGCGTWVRNAPAVPTAAPGPGVWRVGVDIQPGTYRSSGGETCFWARIYGFQGNSVLDSNILSGPTTVTILATDLGFESNRCGTWSVQ